MLKSCTAAALLMHLVVSSAQAADLHTCKLSADLRSVTVSVTNSYARRLPARQLPRHISW